MRDDPFKLVHLCIFLRFGYIDFEETDSAKEAMKKMDGKEVDGRRVFLDFAKPRDSPGGGGFGGGFGGGRGRGGRGGMRSIFSNMESCLVKTCFVFGQIKL